MAHKFTLFFMGLFLVLFMAIVLYVNATRPRILILHSYSNDYVWTHELNVGLKRVLDDESWLDIRYHDMKTKKSSGDDYLRRSTAAARKAVDTIRPNVLIAVDDYAQGMVAVNYIDSPDMDIVFAGISGSIELYGYDKANNVTGILERKPAGALKEVIILINNSGDTKTSDTPRALFLADTSHSTERDAEYLETLDWSPVEYQGMKAVLSFPEWQNTVMGLKGKSDYLLVGGYRKLHSTSDLKSPFVDAVEVMTWTEANSPVPVIGMNIFNTEEGAMLSVGVSPYEQGEVAASMAVDIIRDKVEPSSIPIRTSSQYVVSIRKSALDRRHIVVPIIFEAFARATNNYFE